MRIVVLGSNGMLGHMVFDYFAHRTEHDVVGTTRVSFCAKQFTLNSMNGVVGGKNQSALPVIKGADYVINCIGVIKPDINEDHANSISNAVLINSLFPRYLADYCEKHNTRLVHITTDCVFSGKSVLYNEPTEHSRHDAEDVYGKSKSLGEPNNAIVLRTSIIGPELGEGKSLLSWVLNQTGTIKGYTNHTWNGQTTLQLSKTMLELIECDTKNGLYHIVGEKLTKYELIDKIRSVFNLSFDLKEHATVEYCIRSLSTDRTHQILNLPDFTTQLEELKQWMNY